MDTTLLEHERRITLLEVQIASLHAVNNTRLEQEKQVAVNKEQAARQEKLAAQTETNKLNARIEELTKALESK